MKRRQFLKGLLTAGALTTPLAAVALTKPARYTSTKYQRNSAYGMYGRQPRGLTRSIMHVDQSAFYPEIAKLPDVEVESTSKENRTLVYRFLITYTDDHPGMKMVDGDVLDLLEEAEKYNVVTCSIVHDGEYLLLRRLRKGSDLTKRISEHLSSDAKLLNGEWIIVDSLGPAHLNRWVTHSQRGRRLNMSNGSYLMIKAVVADTGEYIRKYSSFELPASVAALL